MKHLLFIALGLVLMTTACSKERKLNKNIDGVWKLQTIDGVAVTDFTMVLAFNWFEKKGGSYQLFYTYTDGSPDVTETGTYTLNEDKEIILTSGGATDTLPVDSCTDNELVVIGEANSKWKFSRQ
jgi:hypothetical protein